MCHSNEHSNLYEKLESMFVCVLVLVFVEGMGDRLMGMCVCGCVRGVVFVERMGDRLMGMCVCGCVKDVWVFCVGGVYVLLLVD